MLVSRNTCALYLVVKCNVLLAPFLAQLPRTQMHPPQPRSAAPRLLRTPPPQFTSPPAPHLVSEADYLTLTRPLCSTSATALPNSSPAPHLGHLVAATATPPCHLCRLSPQRPRDPCPPFACSVWLCPCVPLQYANLPHHNMFFLKKKFITNLSQNFGDKY